MSSKSVDLKILDDTADTGQIPVITQDTDQPRRRWGWKFQWTVKQALIQVLFGFLAATALGVLAVNAINEFLPVPARILSIVCFFAAIVALLTARYSTKILGHAERLLILVRRIVDFLNRFGELVGDNHKATRDRLDVMIRSLAETRERLDDQDARLAAINAAVRVIGSDNAKLTEATANIAAILSMIVDQQQELRARQEKQANNSRPARRPRPRSYAPRQGAASSSEGSAALRKRSSDPAAPSATDAEAALRRLAMRLVPPPEEAG